MQVAFYCHEIFIAGGDSLKADVISSRSNVGHGHPKRRAAGDGMDAEMDDPELMFELAEHLGECQCACDHVVYSPSYTACLQVGQVFRTRSNNLDDCL
jgi:hypothetical protein